jgi:F-type H+-transporting ATPase subunit epsilon
MSTIRLQIVTPERTVTNEEVEEVLARGIEGDLGILPHHMPLVTPLTIGELQYKVNGEWEHLAIGGGFMQVRPDAVIVVADTAERSDEIDRERAERARRRAEAALSEAAADEERARAQAELQRALLRLRVAEWRRHEGRRPGLPGEPDVG